MLNDEIMALHKLIVDDFFDTTFSLIAIHCQVEDYRLTYLINKHLDISLKRKEKDLDFNYFMASYPIFEYECEVNCTKWHLISNICVTEVEGLQSSGSLFELRQKTIKTHFLVPEKKKVNFFLKIENEDQKLNEQKIIQNILKIPQVIASYSVNADELKSKNHLIF